MATRFRRTMYLFFLVLLTSIASIANAALLVSVDDATLGVGSVTLDPNDNGGLTLEWLDWNHSEVLGLSPNDVQAKLAIGQSLEAWRFATAAEVASLFTNAGVLDAPIVGLSSSYDVEAAALIALLGATDPLGSELASAPAAFAVLAPATLDAANAETSLLVPSAFGDPSVDIYAGSFGITPNGLQNPLVGAALVRQSSSTVPEPASVTLWLLLGTASIAFGRLRNRKRRAAH